MTRSTDLAGGSGRRRRVLRNILMIVSVLLAVAAFVVGTPFVLDVLGRIYRNDWAQFSNEGQTYGGVAGVLGILALGGVVVSLILQSRQMAADREQAQRTLHADLVSKALDDPDLGACWGPSVYGNDRYDRQGSYTNSIVSFWQSMFEIGQLAEDELRILSAGMFAGTPGRRYWSVAGPQRALVYSLGRARRFSEILDEEYVKAGDGAAETDPSTGKRLPVPLSCDRLIIGTLVVGLAGGAILSSLGSSLRRRRNYVNG